MAGRTIGGDYRGESRTHLEPQETLGPNPSGYRIGLELEFSILPRNIRNLTVQQRGFITLDRLLDTYKEKYQSTDGYIPMKYFPTGDPGYREKTDIWKLTDEFSLGRRVANDLWQKSDAYMPLELVSPIFLYGEYSKWQNSLALVLKFFVNSCEIFLDETCGLHIHVSPLGLPDSKWTLNQLKRISLAVIYFDKALAQLFPENDHTKHWCGSNKTSNPSLKRLEDGQESGIIADCDSVEKLVDVMNRAKRSTFDCRNYAFNFTPMSNNKDHCLHPIHTLEFRSPRATTEKEVIKKWIIFLVTFVHGSAAGHDCIHWDVEVNKAGLTKFLEKNPPPDADETFQWGKGWYRF